MGPIVPQQAIDRKRYYAAYARNLREYHSDSYELVSSICVRLWGTGGFLAATNAKVPQDK